MQSEWIPAVKCIAVFYTDVFEMFFVSIHGLQCISEQQRQFMNHLPRPWERHF